jgi:hypothetical protein
LSGIHYLSLVEVHHHPEPGKKNFKEYLLEGIMIFLAVTLGFFAESIREHLANRDHEKRNIESVIKSTAIDTSNLVDCINRNRKQIMGLDSLISIQKNNPVLPIIKWRYYYYVFKYGVSDYYFLPNNAGIEQLKTTGGFSLIQDAEVIDSIQAYDNFNKIITQQEQDDHYILQQLIDLELKVLDIAIVKDPSIGFSYHISDSTNGFIQRLPEITRDTLTRHQFFGYITTLSISNSYYIFLLEEQQNRARSLISFLKSKYHIE